MRKLVVVLVAILAIFTFIRDFGMGSAKAGTVMRADFQVVSAP